MKCCSTLLFNNFMCWGMLSLAFVATSSVNAEDRAIEILTANGLQPESESLKDYLESLHPDSNASQRFRTLIEQLGDEDFFKREAAVQELIRMPIHSPTLLQKAADGEDPEVAWRAKQVQKLAIGRTSRILYAVFSVIESQELPNLAEPIIKAFSHCEDEYLKARAGRALSKTASEADLELLSKTALGSKDKPQAEDGLRVATIQALEAIQGNKAQGTFVKLTHNSEPDTVRLAASRALANQGNRAAFSTLVSLLESEDPSVRTQSVRILQAASGKRFDFLSYEEADDRAVKVLAWKLWLEEDSPQTKLRYPLKDIVSTYGRTMFANYSQRKVYELDGDGKVVWEQDNLSGVWAVKGLENGHRLIASYTSRFLVEYDARGREVWRFDNLPNKPYSVQRLPNGNTLVPIYGNELLEIRPDKSFARRIKLPETVKWAEQLENGRILVVFYNTGRIAELDEQGRVLWDVTGMGQPYSVERLANGNTLVANRRNNQVVEVDRLGKIVWSYNAKPSLYRAQRLQDGNTLIVTSVGAFEITPGGEVAWQRLETGLRGIDRY